MAMIQALVASLVVAGAVALAAAPAEAQMYRCTGPDGRTLYTSDQSQCPGAEEHRTTGRIQSVPGRAAPDPPAALPDEPEAAEAPGPRYDAARAAALQEQADAARWRRKKREAQAEQQAVAERLPYVERALRFCNRGNELWVEDDDGLRTHYSCDKVEAEAEQLTRRAEALSRYLDQGGLQEECRRAGCLPGWIRD